MITKSKTFDPTKFLKDFHMVPKQLRDYPAWIGFKWNERGEKDLIPLCESAEGPISSELLKFNFERLKLCDGIGVLLQEKDPFVVVIFPNCILDTETNTVNPSLIAAIWRFGSYAEIISKRDIQVWGKSTLSSLLFSLNYCFILFEVVTSGFVPVSAYPLGCSNKIILLDKILTSIQKSEELKALLAQLVKEEKVRDELLQTLAIIKGEPL